MKQLVFLIYFLLMFQMLYAQSYKFSYKSVPLESGFKMDGYWVWGGSVIKVDSIYHLFASRWPADNRFPEGYRNNSEIVRATSESPLGPYKFREIIIGERDSMFWDSNMAHNPTIHRIGKSFVLFYIGSDFSSRQKNSSALLRRIGYAVADSIGGPWKRSDQPVIDFESNNPAVVIEEERIKMMFRDAKLRVFIAEAPSYKGPYKIVNDNVWPKCRLEDFYLYKTSEFYYMICEDNTGCVSGHDRWGIQFYSVNGISDWRENDPLIVYDHDILLENDSVIHCLRRERPQLLMEDGKITHLFNSVYDGIDSWCQPVELNR